MAALLPASSTTIIQPSQSTIAESVLLTLVPRRKKVKKAVKWSEDTVEVNEFSGKKSSKKCCIFHRRRQFGDWSDDDDSDQDCADCGPQQQRQQQQGQAQSQGMQQHQQQQQTMTQQLDQPHQAPEGSLGDYGEIHRPPPGVRPGPHRVMVS